MGEVNEKSPSYAFLVLEEKGERKEEVKAALLGLLTMVTTVNELQLKEVGKKGRG